MYTCIKEILNIPGGVCVLLWGWDLLLRQRRRGTKGPAASLLKSHFSGLVLLGTKPEDFVPKGSTATAEVVPPGCSSCLRHSTGSATSVIIYLSYLMIPDPWHLIIHPNLRDQLSFPDLPQEWEEHSLGVPLLLNTLFLVHFPKSQGFQQDLNPGQGMTVGMDPHKVGLWSCVTPGDRWHRTTVWDSIREVLFQGT